MTLLKIGFDGQVAFPARVLQAMGVEPGDLLQLEETSEGFIVRPHRIDLSRLAPLRGKLGPGAEAFDVHAFRAQPHDPSVRD